MNTEFLTLIGMIAGAMLVMGVGFDYLSNRQTKNGARLATA